MIDHLVGALLAVFRSDRSMPLREIEQPALVDKLALVCYAYPE